MIVVVVELAAPSALRDPFQQISFGVSGREHYRDSGDSHAYPNLRGMPLRLTESKFDSPGLLLLVSMASTVARKARRGCITFTSNVSQCRLGTLRTGFMAWR